MMMDEEQVRAEAQYERNTWHGPVPTPKPKVDPSEQPAAGQHTKVRATSREAYASIQTKLGPKQKQVLDLLKTAKRPANDREIMYGLNKQLQDGDRPWEISDVNGRRKELLDMGLVELATRKVNPETGKRVMYWRAAEVQS